MKSSCIFLPLVLLHVSPVLATDYPVTCVSKEHALNEGPPVSATQDITTIRIRANSGSGRNAVVVNLSLERSAKFTVETVGTTKIGIVSAASGATYPFDSKNGLWLTAGQGVLLALGR